MTTLFNDFETYCEIDLVAHGTSRYARHPSCEVLMCAYAFDNGPVQQWVPAEYEAMPADLREAMRDPAVIKSAWNKPFEWTIWTHVLGLETPHSSWRDTMVNAMACSLPGSLGAAGEVVGLPEDKKKRAYGKALIREFCAPRKPTKAKPWTRSQWFNVPDKWEEFKEYNRQDVEAERAIARKLRKYDLPEQEWQLWFLDQEINTAGLPINMNVVQNAMRLIENITEKAMDRMREITGLDNPNSNKQLLPWLRDNGYQFEDLKAGHVKRALEEAKASLDNEGSNVSEEYAEVLEIRQEISKASVKKFFALDEATDSDGYLRNTLQFAGAGRTWRWAGRKYQAQNLARPAKYLEKHQHELIRDVELLDAESFCWLYDKPMEALSTAVRPVVQAIEDHTLVDADLNAIENRVLGWMSGDEKILDVFRNNRDPYLDFATYMFHEPYEDLVQEYKVLKNGLKRTTAKPGVLGCLKNDTLVLTDSGWKTILDVDTEDRVFDGVEWVRHGGVVYSGEKEWTRRLGVGVTDDHEVLVGDRWQAAGSLSSNCWQKAVNTADGLFCAISKTDQAADKSMSVVAPSAAEVSNARENTFSTKTDPTGRVSIVQERHGVRYEASLAVGSTIKWQIASTPFAIDAPILSNNITTSTVGGGSSVGSTMPTTSCSSSYASLEQTERLRSTDETMTAITSTGTFVSLIEACKTAIEGIALRSNILGVTMRPKSSEECSRRTTEIRAPSQENGSPECPQKTSSEIRRTVEDHMVFDIALAGPRQRYMIWSEAGPLIVHNCGYRLSAGIEFENKNTGEIEATGLLGYAWNMGVKLTKEQAEHSVKTWRETFTSAVEFWYTIEEASKKCVRTGKPTWAGPVMFDIKAPFMRMHLPSGRCLYYVRPRLEEKLMPWGKMKETLTYEGLDDKNQWVRIQTHGGKLTENADQAISRDLLATGLIRAKKAGLDVRLHVHDQIVAMALKEKANDSLAILKQCLSEPVEWAPDLPLGCAGFISPIFIKD